MFPQNDRQLLPAEIEAMTGIEADRYLAQANKLKREGIKCFVNAKKEVVTYLSWVQLAGVQQVVIQVTGEKPAPTQDDDDELELDFSALERKQQMRKR